MRIIEHRLYYDNDETYPYKETPNKSGVIRPRYLIMHYTAGPSAESAINWLTNRRAKASAHVVISRDGNITQLAPFNIKTWHAGRSRWKELRNLNSHSIGIELENAGGLKRTVNGNWKPWFDRIYEPDEVIEAVHKHQTRSKGWHIYPSNQLDVAVELAELLLAEYNLEDILGHDDIARGRKEDPGPAFPMDNFRARVFGREDAPEIIYETTTSLNIRRGPGARYKQLEGSPLLQGTRLEVEKVEGRWCWVEVLDEVNGIMDLEGWVHGRYIRRVTEVT